MQTTYNFRSPMIGPQPPSIEQLTTQYTGTSLEGLITMETPGIQILKINNKTNFKIKCAGAQGARGSGMESFAFRDGGLGACIEADFELLAGDILHILVGQTGIGSTYDYYSDACTGAGGGGTFVVLERDGVKSPLMVAAGGQGGTDQRHSSGVQPAGGSAQQAGSPPAQAADTRWGSGYDYATSTAGGRAQTFLEGGAASTYVYSRGSSSSPGFGCAGSNSDDGHGGGGGGYYGGREATAAVSYIHPELATNEVRESAVNPGNGYVDITILDTFAYVLKKDDDYYIPGEVPELIESELTPEVVQQLPLEVSAAAVEEWSSQGYLLYRIVDNSSYTSLNVSLQASPAPAQIILENVPLNDPLLGVRIVGGAEVTWLVSFDLGTTWKSYHDNVWDGNTPMSALEVNSIPKYGWRNTTNIQLKGYINPTHTGTPVVDSIKLLFAE